MGSAVLGVVAVALVLGAFLLQRRYYFIQYVFFLRYPLLLAVLLAILLPLGAASFLREMLGNLVLLERGQFWIVGSLGVVASWAVMYTACLVYIHTPRRVGLSLLARANVRDGRGEELENPWPRWLSSSRVWMRIGWSVLALPLFVVILLASESQRRVIDAIEMLAGVTLAMGLAWIGERVARRFEGTWAGRRLDWSAARIDRAMDRVFTTFSGEAAARARREGRERFPDVAADDPRAHFTHRSAAGLALFSILLYALGACLGPGSWFEPAPGAVPALAYALMLFIVVTWVLGWLAFQLDKYRIAPELLLVGIPGILYGTCGTDHFFDAQPRAGALEASAPALTPREYVHRRGLRRGDDGRATLLVVAGSGGGIAAAYWTSIVLSELTRELGRRFTDPLALISTTSGGSVGAMYYVDGFGPTGPPHVDRLRRIEQSAGSTSLDAMAWGLVYPDLVRLVLPPIGSRFPDRGSAIEARWRSHLGPGPAPTLDAWRPGVGEGWRPATIFNALLVESGERLLLSTLDLNADPATGRWFGKALTDVCPGHDLPITTAARLSATFPYITPISRPPTSCQGGKAYHVADGGYYDNYGVMSAIEFLRDVLSQPDAVPPAARPKVVLVEIRASDPEDEGARPPPRPDAGFRFATIGPVEGMLATQSASQFARNELEVDLLGRSFQRVADVESVVFKLGGRRPLSWHLSRADQATICRGWSDYDNPKALQRLREILGGADAATGDAALCQEGLPARPAGGA